MEPSSSMNSSDISTISEKMESMSMTHHVVRNNKRLPQSRYSPYILGSVIATIPNTKETNLTNEKQKDEAERLGVELSVFVAEAMFLLSDDLRSMLHFCVQIILKYIITRNKEKKNPTQVVKILIYVMLYVFETYIKPKNGVYQADGKSTKLDLIKSSTQHFAYGVRSLEHIVLVLENGGSMPPIYFEHYNQELKKLEEKLRSSKDVLEANGFVGEAMKSNILHLWKSLFVTLPLIFPRVRIHDMFRPLLNQARQDVCSRLIASLHI
ncbi:unnamed protein product [Arabidopsis lyrata]|uniref:Uncharacterized protein n=1 Tax=Arabidopsis lyrata subsp. lyrata TaxID=81972 RepID=D7KL72_ARALL|nr:uncharacterized protein LOC9329932 [Arabidopsis lyrata subsp. lyrata]EFH67437.1 hypothetical protein ARALYDRAFT_891181 [Arabidopsis lyrata subsp. lyrata]CAH8254492.1 unnamed protein product [Arabidopsis lyrata]|eukprot:XP_002891178.1 uncharacterized protein LOC9329932 [Arabidopsis lyrata subsp. lyrata]